MDKDYIQNIEGAERRFFVPDLKVETREGEKETTTISGHAALFNSRTNIGGMFEEEIMPGAFDGITKNDIRVLINHDPNLICGRTKSGTATVYIDEKGLVYSFEPDERSYVKDLAISIRNGDIDSSSFAFMVADGGQKWTQRDNGIPLRTITKFSQVLDVSAVTFPAYPDATVGMRSLAGIKKEKTEDVSERNERKTFRDAQLIINKNNSQ